MVTYKLVNHPSEPAKFVNNFFVDLFLQENRLSIFYRIYGDLTGILIPDRSDNPDRRDSLWMQTCCELFLRRSDSCSDYREFNLSPSRNWAAYNFTDYRAGMSLAEMETPPQINSKRSSNEFILMADLDISYLDTEQPLISVCGVIETLDHTRSYWALSHPNKQPDFHHAEGFVEFSWKRPNPYSYPLHPYHS
jgi:hypothetical protein